MSWSDNLKRQGNVCFKNGNFDGAVNFYTQAIEAEPCAAYYTNRALTYINLNEIEKALHDTKDAIRLDPTYQKGIQHHIQCLLKMDQNNVALQWANKLCQIENNQDNQELLMLAQQSQPEYQRLNMQQNQKCQNSVTESMPNFSQLSKTRQKPDFTHEVMPDFSKITNKHEQINENNNPSSFSCAVCRGQFRFPVAIACGHTFCYECLQNYGRQHNLQKCPVCQSNYTQTDIRSCYFGVQEGNDPRPKQNQQREQQRRQSNQPQQNNQQQLQNPPMKMQLGELEFEVPQGLQQIEQKVGDFIGGLFK